MGVRVANETNIVLIDKKSVLGRFRVWSVRNWYRFDLNILP